MKKYIINLFIILISFIIVPINVNAKTLGELKEEYNKLEQQYSSKNNEIKYTESEISAAQSRIQSIYTELEVADKEIQSITKEISKLNESIFEKDAQTKELMKFFQLSQGESTYLEYIFSADSITDFIYRITVTEQLSKYNDKLINEMNEMIDQNNKNINALHAKEESLTSLQKELSEKLVILSSKKESLHSESLDIEEEIKAKKSVLDYYVKAGCKDNEDVSICTSSLPPGTKFYRPVSSGCITSNYGYRICPIHGQELHSGIDMACGDRKIYSVSDGQVGVTGYSKSMGNYIVIWHNINGKKYSSVYMHLASIYVKQGDIVNKDTNIGYMGTTGASTGVHLHLSIYIGYYLKLGESYSLTDPRNYINFPTYNGISYSYFYNRTTYYK